MSGRDRCEEILRLIDDALADYDRAGRPRSPRDGAVTHARPRVTAASRR